MRQRQNINHLFGALGAEVHERQLQLGARQHHRRQRQPRVRRPALQIEAGRHPRGHHRRQRVRYVRHDGCASVIPPLSWEQLTVRLHPLYDATVQHRQLNML